MNEIYWKQTYIHAREIRDLISSFLKYAKGDLYKKLKKYLLFLEINYGPYEPLEDFGKILPEFHKDDLLELAKTIPKNISKNLITKLNQLRKVIFSNEVDSTRPKGANLYSPYSATKRDFEVVLGPSSKSLKEKLSNEFKKINTLAEITADDQIIMTPYEVAYRPSLVKASKYLLMASDYADGAFKVFLRSRALALLSGDFRESDEIWIDVDSDLNIVIGPIEVYIDKLFGYKGAYEAKVTIRDKLGTDKLRIFRKLAPIFETNLPCPEEFKKNSAPPMPPTEVVEVVYYAGEANTGMKNVAWQLPNDETIIKTKGYRVFLAKNVLEAKAEGILIPILQKVLDLDSYKMYKKEELKEAFSTRLLLHEFGHPSGIRRSKDLMELFSPIEEAKADILSLFFLKILTEKKIIQERFANAILMSYAGEILRSVRFGVQEAHGMGACIIMNYLHEHKAIEIKDEKCRPNLSKMRECVESLSRKILTIEGEGDYKKAKDLIETYGSVKEQIQILLNKIRKIPIDVILRYPIAPNYSLKT